MSEGAYLTGSTRAGDNPTAAPVSGGTGLEKRRVRFLASDVAAPTTPALPIAAPAAPTELGAADALGGSHALLLWADLPAPGVSPPPGKSWRPYDTDMAWRWQKHRATPSPAPLGASAYMSRDGAGISVEQQAIPSGGGSYEGFVTPVLGLEGGKGPLLDALATPVYSLVVQWDSRPVDVNGTPGGSFSIDGFIHRSSPTQPSPPRYTAQPIVGCTYTNSPFVLYILWSGTWVPSGLTSTDWVLSAGWQVFFTYGGSGGPTAKLAGFAFGAGLVSPFTQARGTTVMEFNNTTHKVIVSGMDPRQSSISVPGGYTNPYSLFTTPEGWPGISDPAGGWPGNWPGDYNGNPEVFASSNMGAYYWSSYRQLEGHIVGVAVVALTAEETVTLLSNNSVVPGTGPIVPSLKFRAGDETSRSLSAQLSEYAHYWPLDDPRPGPMYDVLAGSYLTVVNPSLATFQTDGIVNPLAPTHTKAIRLGRGATPGSSSYLTWNNAGPSPSIGTGAVGVGDLTFGCWIRWEGPVGSANAREIIRTNGVPFGFVNEPALTVRIFPFAEPFGVEFETWDATGSTFKTLRTQGFDWPAEYLLDYGDPLFPYVDPIPYKGPTWAYLTVVLRTVSGHMTQEIWVDGVLVAQQAGADGGWGANVQLLYVGRGIQAATMQHLTFWPFALDPAAISGAGSA